MMRYGLSGLISYTEDSQDQEISRDDINTSLRWRGGGKQESATHFEDTFVVGVVAILRKLKTIQHFPGC